MADADFNLVEKIPREGPQLNVLPFPERDFYYEVLRGSPGDYRRVPDNVSLSIEYGVLVARDRMMEIVWASRVWSEVRQCPKNKD